MVPTPPSSPGALVLDANVVIAISSKETGRDALATAEITRYVNAGYQLYAPGVIIAETLYVLCGKKVSGSLSLTDYTTAVTTFERVMASILPPPNGDVSLIQRAEQIGNGYGCSRSADGIYIALAEELTANGPTALLTFDQGCPNQAAAKAPTVTVRVLV
jgi:predicted nucleic acid-binding protein